MDYTPHRHSLKTCMCKYHAAALCSCLKPWHDKHPCSFVKQRLHYAGYHCTMSQQYLRRIYTTSEISVRASESEVGRNQNKQCCRKCKILARLMDHLWLMVGWSVSVVGSLPINNLLGVRPCNQSKKWSKWTKWDRHFTKAQWTFDISASVESFLHFYSETFSASIGRQTDHLSMVGPWVAQWTDGSHLATGRMYFSSTEHMNWWLVFTLIRVRLGRPCPSSSLHVAIHSDADVRVHPRLCDAHARSRLFMWSLLQATKMAMTSDLSFRCSINKNSAKGSDTNSGTDAWTVLYKCECVLML